MEKEPTLQQDLRVGQINPKLRIPFHAGHFSTVTAALFFNLVRPPIIIIETGQSADRVYTCVYTYRRAYTRVIRVYSSCLSSPEQGESISLCYFCRATASSFTHRDWTLHADLHTHRLELYIDRQEIYHGKIGLHTQCNAIACLTHLQKGSL